MNLRTVAACLLIVTMTSGCSFIQRIVDGVFPPRLVEDQLSISLEESQASLAVIDPCIAIYIADE